MAPFGLLWLAVFAAEPVSAADSLPKLYEIQVQVSELLKIEAVTKDSAARARAVRAMCRLHAQIVGDERYATSDKLKEYRARLWSRLTKIKGELKQQLASDAKS